MKKTTLTIFSLFIAISFCFAQNSNYYSKQITINDGLSHNTIECVFKDSDGFMWFGTHNGLNRYDGTNIKSFQHNLNDTNTISGDKILCVNEDLDQNIWVGTSGHGLNRFDKESNIFYNYLPTEKETSIPHSTINNIKVLGNGTVWICSGNGLTRYNKHHDNFTNFFPKSPQVQSGNFWVYDIIQAKSGKYYVATTHDYIYEFNEKTGVFTPVIYSRSPHLTGNYRKHLAEDNKGNIWISAFTHGLIKLNPESGESQVYTPNNSGLTSNLLNGDLIIRDNKLWLTTDGSGIIIYDLLNDQFSAINYEPNKDNSLFDNKIYSIFIDEQNIVWVGTFNEGVNILNPNQLKFSTLKTHKQNNFSLKGISVLSVFEDSRDQLWLGTDGDGLFLYQQDSSVTIFKHDPNNKNSISADRIISINEYPNGTMLFGTYTGGLNILNSKEKTFTRYLTDANNTKAIAAIHVWDIFIDSDERIWLGLLGEGLDRFVPETKEFIHYGPNTDNYNRINHDNVMSIIEDKDGDLWFGTEGRGVNILDKQSQQMYHSINTADNNKLSNHNVLCIYEDRKGIIWIGTGNGGLNRYDKKNKTIRSYNMTDGLPSNIISSIIEDNNACLWLGTAYGISKFNPKTGCFRNYDIKDGLLGYVINRNGTVKRKDGSIIIGTTNGLNMFNPNDIKDIEFTPKTIFTGLRIQNELVNIGDTINGRVVLNKDINYEKKITIRPKDKIFTLEFAALTYTLPEKCKFKYQLEGFEKTWKTSEASRQYVTYSNLNPGNYTFKVKAANSDGLWSSNEKTLRIIVLPSFWQSIWFKLLIAFLILLIFYAWYRYKLRVKEKQFLNVKVEQNRQIMHLEKEKLENELNNQTFNILSRNKALLKHQRRLNALLNKVDKKTRLTLEAIIQEIDQEVNEEKDWKHIEPRLDKVYNNFMTTLKTKSTTLTQSELRVAAYVRMGLSTKEISELFQKTTKAIDNDRYRLRKKLDIPMNDSLKKYLLDL